MNKKALLFFAVLFTFLFFSSPSALAENMDPQATYSLPLSLKQIENDAFSDTAAESVIFPDGLISIGENAFSGATSLTDVYIPESTEYIAESAFSETTDLVIHGISGSCAEDWAKEHKVPFVEENIWKLAADKGETVSDHTQEMADLYRTVHPDAFKKIVSRAQNENESRRPQDRPELNPIDYRFP